MGGSTGVVLKKKVNDNQGQRQIRGQKAMVCWLIMGGSEQWTEKEPNVSDY